MADTSEDGVAGGHRPVTGPLGMCSSAGVALGCVTGRTEWVGGDRHQPQTARTGRFILVQRKQVLSKTRNSSF